MQKLTQKNINNIIYRYKRGENVASLSSRYDVSMKRIYQLVNEYKETSSIPSLHQPGRKKNQPTEEIKSIVLQAYLKTRCGANILEAYIEKTQNIHIPHNTIHKILLEEGHAEENPKKKKQRKYCRYQREHSMTLWHTDWKELHWNGETVFVTAFIDDRSRFVVGYGVFSAQTTENTLIVLEEAIGRYGSPEQIVTDNGSQYITLRVDDQSGHRFAQFLKIHGIRHIRSRVHHPQTNGKIERFFREIEERIEDFRSVDAIVQWQNSVKPHSSLGYLTPEEVFWSALKPERILEYVNRWFWDIWEEKSGR